jgi:cysteinyl-tRNA synthetase
MGLLASDERLEAAKRRHADLLQVVDSALNKRSSAPEMLGIEGRIAQRTHLRQQKKWKEADEIRAALEKEGIVLEDRPDGTTDWRYRQ